MLLKQLKRKKRDHRPQHFIKKACYETLSLVNLEQTSDQRLLKTLSRLAAKIKEWPTPCAACMVYHQLYLMMRIPRNQIVSTVDFVLQAMDLLKSMKMTAMVIPSLKLIVKITSQADN